jgi:hypothetical protein
MREIWATMEEVIFSENGFIEPKEYLSPHNNLSKFKTSTKKKEQTMNCFHYMN